VSTLELIDQALADHEVSMDAMRWTPDEVEEATVPGFVPYTIPARHEPGCTCQPDTTSDFALHMLKHLPTALSYRISPDCPHHASWSGECE